MTHTFSINGKSFQKGLKYAKSLGGKYNPATKTWTISLDSQDSRNHLRTCGNYGLIAENAEQLLADIAVIETVEVAEVAEVAVPTVDATPVVKTAAVSTAWGDDENDNAQWFVAQVDLKQGGP